MAVRSAASRPGRPTARYVTTVAAVRIVRTIRRVAVQALQAPRGLGGRGAVIVLLLLLAGAVLVDGLLRVRIDTSTESFLSANDPAVAALEQRARDFGGDPLIVLLRYRQPGEFVSDTARTLALLRLEGGLAKLPDVATVYGPATVLNQLAGAGQEFLLRIAALRDGTREAAEAAARASGKSNPEAAAAGQAAVDQVNLRYAPLLVRGLPVGMPTVNNPRFGQTVVFGPDGLARPDWRFIVPAPDTVAILVRPREAMDQEHTQRLVESTRAAVAAARLDVDSVTVSGVPAVTAELAGEVQDEAPLIGGLVALAVLLRFLLVPVPSARGWWQRLRPLIASVLGSAATLAIAGWAGRPLSLGVVALLPLLLGVGSSFPLYLAAVPNRRRILAMSVASAGAFLTLALSPLPFVRDLGFALAAGVLLSIAAALALERFWPTSVSPDAQPSSPSQLPSRPASGPPGGAGRNRSGPVRFAALVAAAALAAGGWVALPGLDVSSNPTTLARGLPALADAQAVESVLGASGEIAVQLTGPNTLTPATLAWVEEVHRILADRFADRLRPVVGVPSFFGFLGPQPTAEEIDSALELVPRYLSSTVVRPDRQVALLVYGVRLQDLEAQGLLLRDIDAALPRPPAGYSTRLVGLPVAAVSGYRQLLSDRYLANLGGIALAGIVLALLLRRRWDAARAMLAALLATGWGLGAVWLLDLRLTPLTMGLGSLVSVTACEFVVLLAEARRAARSWLWSSVAIACLTSVLGYLALVASRLWMVREFGLVLAVAVVLSYLAARLVIWRFPPAGPGEPATATGG